MPTRSTYDFEIELADGTVVPLMLDPPRDRSGNVVEGGVKTLVEQLEPLESDIPAAARLEPVEVGDWSGGVGVHYDYAEGVYTRTEGYAVPAGLVTDVAIPAGSPTGNIHAMCEYNGDLYFAQFGDGTAGSGRVLKATGGNPPLTVVSGGSFPLGANEYIVDLTTYHDGAGNQRLYACSNDLGGLNGRLHKWDGTTWSSTSAGTFGTAGRYRFATVLWQTRDGMSGWRLVTISGLRTIAYTIPEADPMLASSWVEAAVRIESRERLKHLVASRRHVWVSAPGELFDLDEQGNAHSITSYSWNAPSVGGSFDPGDSAPIYHDGWIYTRLGTGLDRIDVRDEVLAELPGQCGPGWMTPAETPWGGFVTALAADQGYVVAALYSPYLQAAGIFWGKDARYSPDVKTRNPLVWHGPEVFTRANHRVMKLHVSGLGGRLRLWISATSGTGVPSLAYASLPVAGSPINDLMAGGSHRFSTGTPTSTIWNPYCSLVGRAADWDSLGSVKHLSATTVTSRGLKAADPTTLGLSTRADPLPGDETWEGLEFIAHSPIVQVEPSPAISGARIQYRMLFSSGAGGNNPPKVGVLDLVRMTAWRAAPQMSVWELPVAYGAGVFGRQQSVADPRTDPDEVTRLLEGAAMAAPVAIRDPRGLRWEAKVMQVFQRRVSIHGEGSNKTVRATLRLGDVRRVA